jgi:hypothetical protein
LVSVSESYHDNRKLKYVVKAWNGGVVEELTKVEEYPRLAVPATDKTVTFLQGHYFTLPSTASHNHQLYTLKMQTAQ